MYKIGRNLYSVAHIQRLLFEPKTSPIPTFARRARFSLCDVLLRPTRRRYIAIFKKERISHNFISLYLIIVLFYVYFFLSLTTTPELSNLISRFLLAAKYLLVISQRRTKLNLYVPNTRILQQKILINSIKVCCNASEQNSFYKQFQTGSDKSFPTFFRPL